jgi:5'-nucleotidase (lipoprotein e(P4) family)
MACRLFIALFAACALSLASPPRVMAATMLEASYDCHARITNPRPAPPPAPGETDSWQCTAPKNGKLSTAVDWFRDSLEYCHLATTAYRDATRAAYRNAVRYGPNGWIVIMDADETVLDNSLYERERQRCGLHFSEPTWDKWLKAGIATAIPGAAVFTQTVHRLGGLVAIVTNRDAGNDPVTRANLKAQGIWFDYEIGLPHGEPEEKSSRWRAAVVSLATATGGTPTPVMWVGDQVTDFPILDSNGQIMRAMTQNDDGAGIGESFFLIPNPIYGNWSGNPQN